MIYTTKAMGPDRISPIILSMCSSALYKPLHYLLNLCLNSGYLPFEWKLHKVTPIYKSDDHRKIKNYRPITLLCNTSKVLEWLIFNKIIDYVSFYIKPAQFGFMPCSYVYVYCSANIIVYGWYFQIPVKLMPYMQSLKHCVTRSFTCFCWHCWLWFRAYPTNRFQYVSVNNHYSQLLPVESGVPQGSILGPLSFI